MIWRDMVPPGLVKWTRPARACLARWRGTLRDSQSRRRVNATIPEGYVAVDFCNEVGIGARLVWCLNVLAYCEDHHLDADFRFSFPASPGTDFFSPFFSVSPIRRSNARRRFVRAVRLDAVPHEVVSLERGSELARKYLVPQPEIVAELDQFWSEQRLDGHVLGVHYRGTDKTDEAPRVEYEAVAARVTAYVAAHRDTSAIFVSSDERAFVDFAAANFGDLPIVFRDDFRRADSQRAIYRDLDDVLSIQRDAVVNSLLLARCRGLIKTASFLSAFSALLNPEMDTFIMNTPHDKTLWFPEREMLRRQIWA